MKINKPPKIWNIDRGVDEDLNFEADDHFIFCNTIYKITNIGLWDKYYLCEYIEDGTIKSEVIPTKTIIEENNRNVWLRRHTIRTPRYLGPIKPKAVEVIKPKSLLRKIWNNLISLLYLK